METTLKVCIVDDHTIFRKAFKEIVLQQPNIEVAFDAPDGITLFERLSTTEIDIVLLDLYLPTISGIEIIKTMKCQYPKVKIIVISSCIDLKVIDSVFDLGVHAYISKSAELREFWDAIAQVSQNRLFENSLLKQTLYWKAFQKLTVNNLEQEIKTNSTHQRLFELLWQEKNTQEIARDLFMSISSIEKLKQSLKEKTGAKSTIGLIKYALNENLILIRPQNELALNIN